MNRTNRTQRSNNKNSDLNFAPTIIKCTTILEAYPLKNPIVPSSFIRGPDVPLDLEGSLKIMQDSSPEQAVNDMQ